MPLKMNKQTNKKAKLHPTYFKTIAVGKDKFCFGEPSAGEGNQSKTTEDQTPIKFSDLLDDIQECKLIFQLSAILLQIKVEERSAKRKREAGYWSFFSTRWLPWL